MARPLIIVDENIPLAHEAFAPLGEVRLVAGRGLSSKDLRGADALVVRSVTRVNAQLLDESNIRFVGTATIGTDHIDIEYLRRRGIAFSSAAGCNANSVAEYLVAALVEYAGATGTTLEGKTLGIVGRGNIGSRVAELLPALGLRILVNDPPLQRAETPGEWTDLDTILRESDIITFHVPLTHDGLDRTHHLIEARHLERVKRGALLVNCARGPVINNADLRRAIEAGKINSPVLDVFENEPDPDWILVERCLIATPHIAGYSHDGKINGTRIMARALARVLHGQTLPQDLLPLDAEIPITLEGDTDWEKLRFAVRTAYPIMADDARMREALALDPADRPAHFDRLRREYPVRLEFPHYRITGAGDGPLATTLARLGFTLAPGAATVLP